jgi:hypothetical protein
MAEKGMSDRVSELMDQVDNAKDLLIVSERSCHFLTEQWGFEFLEDSMQPFGKQFMDTIHAVDNILFDLIPRAEKIRNELDNISVALAQNEKKDPQAAGKQI